MRTPLRDGVLAPATIGRRSLDGLTPLRGLAALGVFLFHLDLRISYQGYDLTRAILFVDHYYLGVDLFFILSGFIIAYVHGRDFPRLSLRRVSRFFLLRLARIYPVHLCTMLLFLGLFAAHQTVGERLGIALSSDPSYYSLPGFIAHLGLVESGGLAWNFPAWSVSAEWFAYLWFPLLAYLALPLSRRACLVALVAVVAGFALVYGLYFEGSMDHPGLVRVSFEFAAGMLIYRSGFDAPKLAARAAMLLVLALAVALATTRFADFAAVLALGTLVLTAARMRPRPWPRWALWLGEISYSIYMVQALILATVGSAAHVIMPRLSGSVQLALILVQIAALLAAAAIMYRVVELPARLWLRVWIERVTGPAAAISRRSTAGPAASPQIPVKR